MLKSILKKLNRLTAVILNSKATYIIILLMMLIQFLLVSIIFFQNRRIAAETETLLEIKMRQNQMSAVLNALEANLMRLAAEMYRLQSR